MKEHAKGLIACLTLVFFLAALFPAYAGQLEEKQKELRSIQQEIAKRRDQIKKAKQQEKDIMKQIEVIENGMEETRKEIQSLDKQVSVVEGDIDSIQRDIQKAEAHLNEQTDYLAQRLVTVYETGDVSYLEVLLDSTDIVDFLTRYDLLKEIVSQDMQLIEEIQAERADLEQKKKLLEAKKSDLLYTKQKREAQAEFLEEQAGMKQEVLNQVQNQREQYEKALEELEETSRELERLIRSLQKPESAYQGTGIFCWPAPGYTRVTSEYGMRYHPILGIRKLHTGIDIGAPYGARVVAADGGTVIYTGRMGGYGNTIVVDHGGGVSTLYAHLSAYRTSTGARVDKGDTIGLVGSTGWSTGAHLHFEVRKNGTPVDPRGWI
ncbi:murein hydrolase activator EnvC family protein [Syntrophothermus lipocalidus]|uniref:Peptidase M23 n=1 Tax=Syntrophothermus lipocalidus (strain DSM 12680 / TGB-C1) TaxID=643648 RepID=D7CPI9_SYNLT|nr:M23 family metallopeptidase [Syntrophothermus lipocalidus]ADI02624.1 Peptidase M23 [Syntrophothermus lipocalidus DSM 12680]